MIAPAWTMFTPEDRAIAYRSGASHDMVCASIREATKLADRWAMHAVARGEDIPMKPRTRTYRHPYVARLGQHYIALTSPLLAGPHSALAYLTGERIYTRDACFERRTGALLYGVLRVPTVLASETVLAPGDVTELALWGARGWALLSGSQQVMPWAAPAYLPTLDT